MLLVCLVETSSGRSTKASLFLLVMKKWIFKDEVVVNNIEEARVITHDDHVVVEKIKYDRRFRLNFKKKLFQFIHFHFRYRYTRELHHYNKNSFD